MTDSAILYRQASVRPGQAAELLEVTARTVWNMVTDGRLERHGQTGRISTASLKTQLCLPDEQPPILLTVQK
jgi:hypothetical protein